jgi:hypothetical protein
MKRCFSFLPLLIAMAICATDVHASDPTTYKLNDDSTYQTGCFAPCLCPVLLKQPVSGTFKLTLASSDGLFDFYDVTEVSWLTSVGGTELRISGSGTYQVGGEFAVQQRLTLELSINGGSPIHFDSGLLAGGGEFPNVNITISINGIRCHDTVIVINASPAKVIPYSLVDGSTYQEGCFPPGLCPMLELPVVGTFGLVKLHEGPLFTDYAVVDVDWRAVSRDAAVDGSGESLPIVGTGRFRIGGEFALQQQLSLDLSVNGGPLRHFDSGLVIGGGEFPLIDVEISVKKSYRFDQVIHVIAEAE